MARHEVVIHENTSATSAVAPYLGNYIAKETLAMAAFASAIGAKCGLPAIQVIAILDGSFQAIEDLEREGLVRVHTDIGVICAVIKGSFPTADAAFDPERNSLELALRLDDAIQLDLSDTVPVIVTDENVTKLRVDNVMDLVEERPMNLVHGKHVFRVAGFNMVLSDEGATAYLENDKGVTFPLVVDEVVSKQLFKAHTAELLPGGDYKLVVKSRAGDAGGPLQTSFRKIKYLRVVDPEPVPVPIWESSDGLVKVSSVADGETGDTLTWGNAWSVLGEGFTGTEPGWFVEIVLLRPAPGADPVMLDFEARSATEVRLTPGSEAQLEAGDYPNAELTFGIAHESAEGLVNETAEIPVHLVVGA
ncbi:MAG: hypothetical protein IJG13_14805 [Kiritimatiellae bacterium]|nr:hypothetical protein [Kiritimatiellia bacterium]